MNKKIVFLQAIICLSLFIFMFDIQVNGAENPKIKGVNIPTKVEKNYTVKVSTEKQYVYVYYGSSLIRVMKCSTGTDNAPTPIGSFYTSTKGTSFFSSKYNEGGYYWTSFLGNYLFHSIPFDQSGRIIQNEERKLGQRASHGCIRLSIKDARWFFNKIPTHTLVRIT
jgi:lipoprotein-anchoring transpeptidase ErfK/SrfK